MTPRQTAILALLQAHRTPLTREAIVSMLPRELHCNIRRVQEEIKAIEDAGVMILAGKGENGGYEIASAERGNLAAYWASTQTEERLVESHAARIRHKQRLFFAAVREPQYDHNGQGVFAI